MNHPASERDFQHLLGYRPDAIRADTLFEVKDRVRDLRQLKAALLQLAIALGHAPKFSGALVLVDPGVTWERLGQEWEGLQRALNQDVFRRLRLVVREAGEFRGIPTNPAPREQAIINEIVEDQVSRRHSRSRRSSGSFYDVLRVLLVSWFRREGPLSNKRICEITGYSYPTVAQALHDLEPRLIRHSDRSVELMAFPQGDWMRFVSNSVKLRGSTSFTDRSGSPRPAEKIIERLRKVLGTNVAVGGILGARHYLPGIDLVGTPRLDVTLDGAAEATLAETIQRVDPGLKPARRGEPGTLVVHFTRLAAPLFAHKGEKLWADEVDCLLDLHDARLEAQAQELLEHLSPRPEIR